MKTLLKATLLVAFVGAVGVAWVATRTPSSAFDGQADAQTQAAELLNKGEYVARLSDCVACHSTAKGKPFAGGLEMATPLGSIFATNITPDKQTGIGHYSLAEFDRAVRHGVARDGHRLYPAMPYPSYQRMSDEDIRALYAFFMGGVVAVSQQNQEPDIPWPLNMRWPLSLWNLVFAGTSNYQVEGDASWQRGAYIVQGAGHCGSCHTPRGLAMSEKALDERDPRYLAGALLDGWYAPSLRNDPNTGLGRWSEGNIVGFLKNGRNQHGVVYGSMADAFNNSTQFMSDDDLKSIARYLKSLPGDPTRDGTPWQYDHSTVAALAVDAQHKPAGAKIYMAKCGFCHGADGRGQNEWIAPLAGTASSLSEHNASSINVVLNGSPRVVANNIPDSYRMPPFRAQLSDQEVSELLTFVRSAWGNHGGPVTRDDVSTLRAHTDPASSSVRVLQMR